MYTLIQGIGIVFYVAAFIFFSKKYKISTVKSIMMAVASMIIYFVLVKFTAWIELGFKGFGAENAIRVYALLPFCMYGVAKFAKVEPYKMYDTTAISGVLMYGVGHIACVFEGCCHGFSYYEGTPMYNLAYTLTGTNMLPMQWIESICALIIFVILALTAHFKKYQTNGRLLCMWFLIFGAQRFFWEFFRDNTKIIKIAEMQQADGYIGISNLAIWSLIIVIEAIVFILLFRHLDAKKKQKAAASDGN